MFLLEVVVLCVAGIVNLFNQNFSDNHNSNNNVKQEANQDINDNELPRVFYDILVVSGLVLLCIVLCI